ncbi:MAG TPA: SDR family oxidoreductase [Thermohalobaculum sp.]|nr:SDR family oxidoreductase [Thermohalobaculum sp.]
MPEIFPNAVLVTGAASGIGQALSNALIAAGSSVVGLDCAAMAPAPNFHPIVADLTDPQAIDAAVAAAFAAVPEIDALVNCAGIYPVTPMLELPLDEWNHVLDINLRAPFLLTQALARRWVAAGTKAAVVNIASTSAVLARPGTLHYAASKAGLIQMTRGMALELAPHCIRVNAVAPGVIATERVMAHATGAGAAEHTTKLARVPAGRVGKPQEVVEATRWLLSPAAAYCVGSVLTLDGGYTLGIPSY